MHLQKATMHLHFFSLINSVGFLIFFPLKSKMMCIYKRRADRRSKTYVFIYRSNSIITHAPIDTFHIDRKEIHAVTNYILHGVNVPIIWCSCANCVNHLSLTCFDVVLVLLNFVCSSIPLKFFLLCLKMI